MSKKKITNSLLSNIADTIRSTLGVSTIYKPSEMSAAVASISSQKSHPLTVTLSGSNRYEQLHIEYLNHNSGLFNKRKPYDDSDPFILEFDEYPIIYFWLKPAESFNSSSDRLILGEININPPYTGTDSETVTLTTTDAKYSSIIIPSEFVVSLGGYYQNNTSCIATTNGVTDFTDATKTYFKSNRFSTLYEAFKGLPNIDNTSSFSYLCNLSACTDMKSAFYNCLCKIINISTWNRTSNVTNMNGMFYNCNSLLFLDVSNLNTFSVTNMSYMFDNCISLESLDLSSFNTFNVIDMSSMFDNCISLKSLDLSSFNTSKLTNMSDMFYGCNSLTSLDVSSFDTSNVTDMSYMFSWCSSLELLDLSNFNTSNVTNMRYMFSYCTSLEYLDLSNFNTSNVTNMSYMFKYCDSLKSITIGINGSRLFSTGINVQYPNSKWSKDGGTTEYTPTQIGALTGTNLAGTWVKVS